jgi:phospholipase/carboxylesterase
VSTRLLPDGRGQMLDLGTGSPGSDREAIGAPRLSDGTSAVRAPSSGGVAGGLAAPGCRGGPPHRSHPGALPVTGGRLESRPRPVGGDGPGHAGPAPEAPPARGPGLHRLAGRGRQAPVLLVPPGADGPRPLVVFFHGAGGQGAGSVHFVDDVAARRGLLVLLPTSAGSTWDLVSGGVGRDVSALDEALADVFATHAVDRVAFAGFSDGGSYALSVGLANGDLGDAVLAFSPGFAAPPTQTGRPRVFISHGRADAVLPLERCGQRVARVLAGAGYDVRYEEFDGGHVVPPELVTAAVDWWLDGA